MSDKTPALKLLGEMMVKAWEMFQEAGLTPFEAKIDYYLETLVIHWKPWRYLEISQGTKAILSRVYFLAEPEEAIIILHLDFQFSPALDFKTAKEFATKAKNAFEDLIEKHFGDKWRKDIRANMIFSESVTSFNKQSEEEKT